MSSELIDPSSKNAGHSKGNRTDMALHRITGITIGVPDPEPVAAFYERFGLTPSAPAFDAAATLATLDGGEQLQLVERPHRQLVELRLGADTGDDLLDLVARLETLGASHQLDPGAGRLSTAEPHTGVTVVVDVAPRLGQPPTPTPATNRPGDTPRRNARAAAVLWAEPPRPRRLGHVVLGSPDMAASTEFFTAGLGFAISDTIPGIGAFMRCSTDHHNLLVQAAPAPFLHHTSWEFDDVDAVGARAGAVLEHDPSCHVWGLGRHHIGSNYFWYTADPAGNFVEAYSDMDLIDDAAAWDAKEEAPVARPLAAWGPPVSIEFIAPPDIDHLIAAHALRAS